MHVQRLRYKVHCKEANLTGDTLQVRLATALGRFVKNGERRQAIGPEGEAQTFRLINNVKTVDNALFGVMLSYESGTNMLVLEDDQDAESCSLMQIAPGVSDAGKRREFVDGLLYFGVVGNTVMIVQRGVMRARNFEEHINWLLRYKVGNPGAPEILLADKVSEATAEKIASKGVKWVEINSCVAQAYDDDGRPIERSAEVSPTEESSSMQHMMIGGLGFEIIKSVLTADMLKQLSFVDALDKDIECSLRIRYVGRTDGHYGQRFMNKIATQLRNVEGAEATLKLQDGETVSGEQIRVTANLQMVTYDGVIDPEPAFDTMLEWYRRQIEGGHMRP